MSKKKQKLSDFKYVDAWYSDQKGKTIPWQRIEKGQVKTFQQEEAFNFNCFATVQAFMNPEKVKGEPFLAPLYFDLDHEEDPSISQKDAAKLVDFFINELDLKESDIWVYFSGSKGFHILISSESLDVEPRNDLHKIFKHIAGYLIHRLELQSLDLVVYTSRRMLRLPNSIHQKTRLYKVELSIDELKNKTLDEIRKIAEQPRRDEETLFSAQDRRKQSAIRRKSSHFFKDKQEEYIEAAATAQNRYDSEEYKFDKDNPPQAVKDLLEYGWQQEGGRNQATVQLSCYFKDAGYTKDEALEVLEEWVVKHTSAKGYQQQQRVANTRSVVDSIYAQDNEYRFSTGAILSVLDEKKRAAYALDLTKYQKDKEDDHEIETLHLSQTGEARYTNKLVKTRIMVVGKRSSPYIVPRQIEYTCFGSNPCKKNNCTLYNMPNSTYLKTLTVKDRELIQMVNVGDDNVKGILRETVPFLRKCRGYNMETIETTNVEELLVIPMAEDIESEEDEIDGRYVLRRVYSIENHDLEENRYYEITGYVVPHPKNQESTIMIRDAEPLQDVVESFELTDEIQEQLAVFQPRDYSPEAIEEKLTTISNDLTYNVTKIVERDFALLGALLTYHSVLRFKVPWANDPIRGWLEFKIVGDTGTGKSELLENLSKFIGLGSKVNAESTSRTGLTYKMEQSGTGGAWYIVWGAWPLADRELIWIDEDTGITKEEYGEMTLARSDGRLEVKRAVTAETSCRVRAILSGNVPKGKRISDYPQGVTSLKDIFNNEDIRRFDFAIFMRSADVDPEVYNRELPTFPSTITEEALKNNILFAWSRKPEDILFSDEAIDEILNSATELSKVYGKANDVPLVSPSDQRNKVARLSVALAALTNSIDESKERIRVLPGHVNFIHEYLKALYNAPGCGLNYYSKLAIKEEDMTQQFYDRITNDLKNVDTLKGPTKFFEFVKLFSQQQYLNLGDVEAMLSIDREEAKAIINQLTRMRMIVRTSGGFRKTPRFNSYISFAMQLGVFDDIDDDYY